jgi:hypothetical protein
MRYLDNFFNYIKESKEIDKSEIESMLLPITDMGVRINYNQGIISSATSIEDKNHGKSYLKITLWLPFHRSDLIIDSNRSRWINDDLFWELLDELLSFRARLLENKITNCLINFNNRQDHDAYISIVLVGDDVEKDDIFILSEISSKLKSTLNSMSSDFSYNTIVRLNDDHIMVESSYEYTDRKFNNLLRRSDIDLDQIKITKIEPDTAEPPYRKRIYNKIELKK